MELWLDFTKLQGQRKTATLFQGYSLSMEVYIYKDFDSASMGSHKSLCI